MKTKFTDMRVDIGDGQHVWFDGNSKVAVGSTFDDPRPNCFSLVSIDDCPGSTPVCESECYTAGLKKFAPALFEKYHHNSAVMRELLGGGPVESLAKVPRRHDVAEKFAAHAKYSAPKGFRWHVSGDVFSERYAQFIALVCSKAPEVPFWIYTRSFDWVHHFKGIDNLTVNLSGDRDNFQECLQIHRETGFRICYMTVNGPVPEELDSDSVIFPSYPLRGRDLDDPKTAPWWGTLTTAEKRMVCPPDFFGQSEQLRCGPCRKCIDQPSSLVKLGG